MGVARKKAIQLAQDDLANGDIRQEDFDRQVDLYEEWLCNGGDKLPGTDRYW